MELQKSYVRRDQLQFFYYGRRLRDMREVVLAVMAYVTRQHKARRVVLGRRPYVLALRVYLVNRVLLLH